MEVLRVKKVLLVGVLAMVLLVAFTAEAFAAPSVAVKSGAMAGLIGVEVGFPTSDNGKILFVGGLIVNGIGVGIGSHLYFLPDGWRPFLGGYVGLGVASDPYYGTAVGLITILTGGVEYVADSGFLFTAEFGIGMVGYYFAPAFGVSLGRQF